MVARPENRRFGMISTDPEREVRTMPMAGDKVRVKGQEGLFVVLRVDEAEQTADLLRFESGVRAVDAGVPLSLVQPAGDYLPELFRWYVSEAPEMDKTGTGE